MASARRCALCYGFDGDLTRKKGQIAHIDQNPANADESNLAYLCLEHHDEYDSKTSQVKGITEAELRTHKARVVAAVVAGEHLRPSKPASAAATKVDVIRGHDGRLFGQADELMSERFLSDFLHQLQSDDSYVLSEARRLDNFRRLFSETSNQFIDENISDKLRDLLESIDAALAFLAQHFFVFPDNQGDPVDPRLCMHPELNVDRAGPGTPESMQRYDGLQKVLDERATAVRAMYKDYRLAVKHYLNL